MALKLIDDMYLAAIANAIRTKKGTSTTMTPAQMPEEILSIPTSTSSGEILIRNGYRRDARTTTGGVSPDMFVKLEDIFHHEIMNTYQFDGVISGGHILGVYCMEQVSADTMLMFLQETISGSTGLPSGYTEAMNFYYILIKFAIDGTITILDSGELPFGNMTTGTPWVDASGTAQYWATGTQGRANIVPSRIFKANNGTYCFHVFNLFQPFIIENNQVVWGTDKVKNITMKTMMSNINWENMNKSSYGQIGDDCIMMTYIGGEGGLTEHRFYLLILELKNNTIGHTLAQPLTADASGQTLYPANVIKFSDTEFAALWGEPERTQHKPLQVACAVSIYWDSTLGDSGFWRYGSLVDKAYWGMAHNTWYQKIDNEYAYLAIDPSNSHYTVLNIYNAGASAASYVQLIPQAPKNNQSVSIASADETYFALGDNYYGCVSFKWKQTLNHTDYYDGYIRIFSFEAPYFCYIGDTTINKNITGVANQDYTADLASVCKMGGRYLWWHQNAINVGNELKLIRVNTDVSVVSTRTGHDSTIGVSINEITNERGEVWFIYNIARWGQSASASNLT